MFVDIQGIRGWEYLFSAPKLARNRAQTTERGQNKDFRPRMLLNVTTHIKTVKIPPMELRSGNPHHTSLLSSYNHASAAIANVKFNQYSL